MEPVRDPCTGEQHAEVCQGTESDIDEAVKAASEAFVTWSSMPGARRARVLYAVARNVQRMGRMLAVAESKDNGKPIHEARDADVPLVAQHFYYHAGWAQLADTELANYQPVGVIAQVIPWNFPLLMLAWKVAVAIALGNTVVLKPAPYTSLTAFLMAEILSEAGVPPGVVNIVPGDGAMGSYLCGHPGVDKIAFTGSTRVGKLLRRLVAGSGKRITLELGGKSPIIVFEDCDLESAVEGVIKAIFFNQGQCCCAGSRLLVQESIAEKFTVALKRRMNTMRITNSLDKCTDMGAVVDRIQYDAINRFLDAARAEGADVWQPDIEIPAGKGLYIRPTLIDNVSPVASVVQEEVFGPVVAKLTFRTASEAIALANNTRYGLGGSVWTENVSLALHIAVQVRAGSFWINDHNAFAATQPFGGRGESGFGREGGKEGLYEYMRPTHQARPRPVLTEADRDPKGFGADQPVGPTRLPPVDTPNSPKGTPDVHTETTVDRTPKMLIGGAQKRPDNNYSRGVLGPDGVTVLGQVGEGNRKDVRDAVEAAHKALPGWGKRGAFNRAQICYYLAENLNVRFEEFAILIMEATGRSLDSCRLEVSASIDRLFTYAAYADKYGGTVLEPPMYGLSVTLHEPTGVVGILCPDAEPLLAFISLLAPALVRANSVIITPSEKHPLPAMALVHVLLASDVPGGVVNVVTGKRDVIAKTLAEHEHVDAVWYFGDARGAHHVERLAADNVKRTFCSYGFDRDWYDRVQGEGEEFLREACETKTVVCKAGDV
jgi:aldehyde dehydrogenase (NAD+)